MANRNMASDDELAAITPQPAPQDASQLAQLSPARLELLARLVKQRGEAPKQPPIPRLPRNGAEDSFALSFAQQRLWFLDQLEPGSPAYNIPSAMRLDGPLDRAALRRSLNVLARRHEVLRTSIRLIEGEPAQWIAPRARLALPLYDLAALPGAAREAATRQLAASTTEQSFDLAHAPLVRTLLLRLASESHVLLMVLHHVIADGWSLGVVMRDLAALYSAASTGQPPQLPNLPFQYADYAIWQRGWVEQHVLAPQRAYWRERLVGLRPLDLPTDYPRPALGSFRGASHRRDLGAPLTAALHALSRRAGVTLFMTLLAAFQTLLARYSGQHDIAVGTPVAGRTHAATEHLLGCFVNTLVLRSDLSGDPTALALLERVRGVTLGAFDHQELPFELLVEALAPERDVARHPLFQVLFVLQNAPIPPIELPGAALRPIGLPNAASKFDLTLTLAEQDGTLEAMLEYRSELFAAPTAQRLLNQFQALLASLVTDPSRRVSALALLSPAERQQLLVEWNNTTVGVRSQESGVRITHPISNLPASDSWLLTSNSWCIHELFEAQQARCPDAVAVVFDGVADDEGRMTNDEASDSSFVIRPSSVVHLTYTELDRRANQLAHFLRARGVGPEAVVALQIERSPELVIALLGVLKAGGAYLPLDPAYPAQRLRYMLDDSQARVLLTNDEGRMTNDESLAFVLRHSSFVSLAADWSAIAQMPDSAPANAASADNLAYVLYTSGSTGAPKGVLTSHRAIRNRLLWMQATYRLAPAERVLHKTPLSFDVSLWELFWPLTASAALVLARPAGHKDTAYLAELIARSRISTLHFVPSLLAAFLAERELARCTSLRRVICSGEALPRELPARFFARLDAELHNLYGPTEAAIDVTAWRCIPAHDGRAVPIGRPIANTQTYVLDAHLRPQPIGVPGELYLGGVQLARGYLARPDLTAERFIPNPFIDCRLQIADCRLAQSTICNLQSAIGMRLYKTGDLARYRADGAIEYLGRLDGQIKLRGQRIELGEIESMLRAHEAVRAVVVLLHAHADSARLVAYIVQGSGVRSQESEGPASETLIPDPRSLVPELRAFLAARLPEYMIPSAFVLLDALPLLPNGKLDRAALPAPDLTPDSAFIAPRTPSEQALAAIWQQVLGLERVGIHDNFFALGGDSIRSIRVLALAREHGLRLALPQLFQHQTIAALADAAISTEELDQDGAALPPFGLLAPADRARLPSSVVDAYPLARLQAGMLFHSEADPDTARYHNFSSIHLRAPCDARALRRALQLLAARHPVLRSAFDLTHFSEPLQLVERAVTIPLTIVDLRALDQATQERALAAWRLAEQQRKFAWQRAPLLRLALLRRSEKTFQLGLVEHHAILDGWSVAVLLRELLEAYVAYLRGQPVPLAPAPRRSFGEFVAAERAVLASEAARQFWAEQLEERPLSSLPRWPATDRAPQPQIRSRAVPIGEANTAPLLRHARTAALPLKALLLAVHLRVLALLSGQEAVLTGLTMNGRSEGADGERVLGLFLNTVPLRLRLPGGSWLELAQAAFVAEQTLLPYRRYPLATLQQQAGGAALFESAFNFVHFHIYEGIRDLAGVEVLEGETLQETNFVLLANFSLDPLEQQLHLTLDYEAAELGDAQMAQIGGYYARALAALACAPEAPYDQESPLSRAERHQLLVERNDTALGVRRQESGVRISHPVSDLLTPDSWLLASASRCIHHLFEAQAARTPDAIAIVFDATNDERRTTNDERLHLTYTELDRRANQLAHFLRARGVGPDVCVALAFERSIELVVGILGVLKAGGAYVPLDPAYPAERIAFMLADAAVPVLLTTTEPDKETRRQGDKEADVASDLTLSPSHLVSGSPRTVVDLRTDWPAIASEPVNRPQVAVAPANLAYVIYTSGSTGQPKGVLTQHAHVTRLFAATQEQFRFGDRDVWTLFHSYAFDFSVWELWGALVHGGRLVVVPHWLSRTPGAFLRLLRDERVTVLNQTPSAFRQLSQAALATRPDRDLRWVIFGGEALDVPSLAPWFEHYGDRRPALVNMYGITETTVHVTHRPIRAADLRNPSDSVIGAPLADLQVYVLDQRQRPAPIGVPGELYVGGAGVARGYLGRPDLTAERFIPNPFAEVSGIGYRVSENPGPDTRYPIPDTRLYKTGDLARVMPNGDLVYLGRADRQVKIRGFRIEPGEVAAALLQHPAVRDAVVIASPDATGNARLVGYVIPAEGAVDSEQGTEVSRLPIGDERRKTKDESADSSFVVPRSSFVAELRVFLKARLPDYMIPSAFVRLDALPLTPSGKLDNRALPPPNAAPTGSAATAYTAPRTPEEELLAELWAQLLGVARVGRDDDFFALGGHSLLATQLIAHVRESFAVELPLRALFDAPTLAGLAAQVATARRAATELPPPLVPVARDAPLPLSFAQQRLWFLDQLVPGNPFYNIPTALRLAGRPDLRAFARALAAVIGRHEALRTTFVEQAGRPVQVIAPTHPLSCRSRSREGTPSNAKEEIPVATPPVVSGSREGTPSNPNNASLFAPLRVPSRIGTTNDEHGANSLPLLDLTGLPAAAREAAAIGLATAEAQRSFDLARGPLVRATLLRLDAQEHVLLLTLHHIVADGWSMGVLIRDLAALYQAFASGRPAALPELPIQYADYAIWQRGWLQGAALDAQLGYWKTQLADVPALRLPTNHPRPAIETFRGLHLPFALPPQLSGALRAFSQREGVTLFMTLLASFQALLARYSGQDDIAVGAPIANRTRAETEHLIGFFVNTLVLRGDLSGDPRFHELLRRVRTTALDAYAHQDLPFEQVVELLQPERDLGRHPLFQVVLALQNAPAPALSLPGLSMQPLEIESKTTKVDLALFAWEQDGTLVGTIEYSVDLFEPTTIARMLGHFQTLLEAVVAEPTRRVLELPLLTEREREQILIEWNATQIGYLSDACIHQLVEAQAAHTPDAVALVLDDTTNDVRCPEGAQTNGTAPSSIAHRPSSIMHLTYSGLNRRANQLAHHLRRLGVGPEARVGLCLERSLDLIVGALAILKAGGAYVPLDPAYPAERLAFMLKDSGAAVLLTKDVRCPEGAQTNDERQRPTADCRLPADKTDHLVTLSPCHLVKLEAEWPRIAQERADNPASGVAPDNLAYVIYTSGSSGVPKGVLVQHRGLCNVIPASIRALDASPDSRVLQAASISFDASVLETFVALCSGASLHLVSPEVLLSPADLALLLRRRSISLIAVTPSLLDMLDEGPFPDLRTITVGGEACSAQTANRWAPGRRLFNVYAPTEATIYATAQECGGAYADGPPIGRPIANTQIYLLDRGFNPAPIGVPGELYIGGVQVARGYHGRPDLTATAFVPDPFAEVSGIGYQVLGAELSETRYPIPDTRLYKTGDLARWRAEGTLEFLGRVDQQIKLRGFRIELGEIEAVLTRHPAVRESAVVVRTEEAANGYPDQRLVAYVVPQPPDQSDGTPAAAWAEAQVEHWQTLYDETYRQAEPQPDAAFNIVGWNSSYTGQPIPAEEMREWVEQTVARIRALRPRRVLEIGCGSGLLLFRLAPDCAAYVGTDFSGAALDYLRRQPQLAELPQVTLLERTADALDDLPYADFDLVILNSVAQYFPSLGYLQRVLAGAAGLLAPGGAIFVGDVRSLPLLESFHTAVQMARAAPTLTTAELRTRAHQAQVHEEELVVDPTFFGTLARQLPQPAAAHLLLKRGRAHNELTQFRYDVVLRLAPATDPPGPQRWLAWPREAASLAELRELLAGAPDGLGLRDVPNARLSRALAAQAALARDEATSVQELRTALADADAGALDPEALWALGDELGYEVAIGWARSGRAGCYDAVFLRRSAALAEGAWAAAPALPAAHPRATLANNPLQGPVAQRLVPLLRRDLQAQLPDYMIPATFVVLDTLPLTPTGKLDRKALPAPERTRPELAEQYVAPRSALETVIAGVWARVLGLGQVGVEDNFFDLGGHSLLATQVVAQLRESFGVPLPVRLVFEAPTVAGLAAALLAEPRQRRRIERTATLLLQIAQLSEDDVDSLIAERAIRPTTG